MSKPIATLITPMIRGMAFDLDAVLIGERQYAQHDPRSFDVQRHPRQAPVEFHHAVRAWCQTFAHTLPQGDPGIAELERMAAEHGAMSEASRCGGSMPELSWDERRRPGRAGVTIMRL